MGVSAIKIYFTLRLHREGSWGGFTIAMEHGGQVFIEESRMNSITMGWPMVTVIISTMENGSITSGG
jgi:hypothetical protein